MFRVFRVFWVFEFRWFGVWVLGFRVRASCKVRVSGHEVKRLRLGLSILGFFQSWA